MIMDSKDILNEGVPIKGNVPKAFTNLKWYKKVKKVPSFARKYSNPSSWPKDKSKDLAKSWGYKEQKGKIMSKEFVDALASGNNLEAENVFKNAISTKVGDALEIKRKEVAKGFVSNLKDEETEVND